METLKESMLKTLEALDEDGFVSFKWCLHRPENFKGLKPIPRYRLETTDRKDTVDLIRDTYTFKAAHIMLNILRDMKRRDVLGRFSTILNVHEESTMETLQEPMLETLGALRDDEFKRFKWFLRQPVYLEGLQPLPKSLLKDADRMDTVVLILHTYSSKAVCIMVKLLEKILRSDLLSVLNQPNVHEESTIETLKEPTMEPQLEELILETLDELDQDEFNVFKWFLRQPVNLEGLRLPKSILKDADRLDTVDLIMLNYSSKAVCIMVKVLQKTGRPDLKIPNVHKESILDTLEDSLEERILKALNELEGRVFEEFKQHLQHIDNLEGLKAIPWKELGEAYGIHTVDLIMQYYPDDAEQIVVNVLQKIPKDDIYDALEMFPDILKGSNKKKRERNQEEPKDDPDASTSTTPREWLPVSKRWRPQLEKLVNMDDSKVKRVESLVFGEDKEFRIAQGSDGVEVFLGLRDDGTEVAVKRMSKLNNLYKALMNDKLYLRLPELYDPSIVRYVDFVEDKGYGYGYLVLQLCEYTLEEYIKTLPEQGRKRLAEQFLNSLRIIHRQDSKILHRDIKPQNVLIDIQGKARLADFGISRRIDKGKNTCHTSAAGTQCWKAKETMVPGVVRYKESTDIQPAGMLIYYILSGGHHPFGDDFRCEVNIWEDKPKLDHVVDVVAKDLVEWMIHGEPEKRPKVKQCLAHPFFWTNTRRVEYLRRIGNENEVQHFRKAGEDENNARDEEEKKLIRSLKVLIPALEQYDDQYAEQVQFNAWKQKFRDAKETRQLFEEMDTFKVKGTKKYSDHLFGLLRFIRNLHAHYAEAAAGINLMEMFPALFGYVYKFAKEQDWNSRPALKEMFDIFLNEEDTASAVTVSAVSTSAASTKH